MKTNIEKQLISAHLIPGMTVRIKKKIYRVESCVKVTAAKGAAFIKTKLRQLENDKLLEKNFTPDEKIEEVLLKEKKLVFLYMENKNYLFLDIDDLERVLLSSFVVAEKADFLKQGVEMKGSCYGEMVFSVELPQFLELVVAQAEESKQMMLVSNSTKEVVLETGAKIEVPLFIEAGDVIKVDTHSREFIQRV